MKVLKVFYEIIFDKVERCACRCASDVTGKNVMIDGLYSAKTKTLLGISIARSLAFMVMHDTYGIKYTLIAKRAGMTEKAVMKSVSKAREFRFSDYLYKKTYKLMMEEL